MKPSHILLAIAFICVLVAGGMYVFAYSNAPYAHLGSVATQNASTTASSAKVNVLPVPDGVYAVYIHSIMSTGEDTNITFSHVTYFEGTAASTSASHDVKCPDHPIEACAPTLTRGFYVRESGVPEFTAPLPTNAPILLRDNSHASAKSLRNMNREFQPVFDVEIRSGNIVSITEKSPT